MFASVLALQVWTALIAAAVAIGVAWWSTFEARRDRRRTLYSGAYRAAMSWVEMLYRVRRRSEAMEDALIEQFHTRQEEIAYYEGWLSTEAPELGRSYRKFVEAVRQPVSPLIQQAWQESPRPRSQATRLEDKHPNIQEARDAFLLDVREHLALWWWVKNRVKERNRETPAAT